MRHIGRLLILSSAVFTIALLLSACGGSSDSSTQAPQSGGSKISQGGSPNQAPQSGGAANPKFPVNSPVKPGRQKNKTSNTGSSGGKSNGSTGKSNGNTNGNDAGGHGHFDSNRSGHGSTPAPAPKNKPVSPVGAPQVQLTPAQQQSKALREQQQGMDRCLAQAADRLGLGAQWSAGTLKPDQMLNINIKAQKCIAKNAKTSVAHNITPPKPPHVKTMQITKPGQVNK